MREPVQSSERKSVLYVDNLPEIFRPVNLRRLFMPAGSIGEAFISKRINKANRRFGFVKFEKPSDAGKAVQMFNGKLVAGNHISVNIAKFDKDHKFVLQDTSKEAKFQENDRRPSAFVHQKFQSSRVSRPGISFKQALLSNDSRMLDNDNGVKEDGECFFTEGITSSVLSDWLKKSVVVVSKSGMKCEEVTERFWLFGFNIAKVRKVGLCLFLVTFLNEKQFVEAEERGWDFLLDWCLNCFKWSSDLSTFLRVTRVAIRGLPWHAWTLDSAKNLLSSWGEVLCLETDIVNDDSIKDLRIVVLANSDALISKKCLCKVDNSIFQVTVNELSSFDGGAFHLLPSSPLRSLSEVQSEKKATENESFDKKETRSLMNAAFGVLRCSALRNIACSIDREDKIVGEKNFSNFDSNSKVSSMESKTAGFFNCPPIPSDSGPTIPPGFNLLTQKPLTPNSLFSSSKIPSPSSHPADPPNLLALTSTKVKTKKPSKTSRKKKGFVLLRPTSSFSTSLLSGTFRKPRAAPLRVEHISSSSHTPFFDDPSFRKQPILEPIETLLEREKGILDEAKETLKVGQLLGLSVVNEFEALKDLSELIRRDKAPC